MTAPGKQRQLVRFGPFAVDLDSGELWREGVRIRLQVQPFQILKVFLERPNELITREELQRLLWPSDTFVDFEQGLNKSITKLRAAICDNVDEPRYIETIPKRGYRFVANVESDQPPASPSNELMTAPALPEPQLPEAASTSHPRRRLIVIMAFAAVIAAVLVWATSKRFSSEAIAPSSIAVIPFQAQGAGAEYDVADGITDSMINNLSLVPSLRVISHASVFQYRGQNVDPQVVGKKLGVAAVLTGRVEQNGTTMKVILELTATADSRHLWGQEYDRDVTDRTALPQEAASAVADALRLRVTPDRRQQIGTQTTSDAEAQQLYLKGRYYFFKETSEDVLRARSQFQAAIDRDPSFALAYAALGDTYDWMATEGYQPVSEVAPQAAAAKSKANELNGSLAEVHASLGGLEVVQWNWAKADLEFQKALQLNPNYFEAHRLYSIYLRTMKRFPESIEHAKHCDELNPLLMPAKSHLALTYYYARQYEAAAAQYRLILKDNPDTPGAHLGLSAVLLKLGKEKEAVQEWQKAMTLAGDEGAAEVIAQAYKRGGLQAAQTTVLKAELQSLHGLARHGYVSPLEFAYRYALLKDKGSAFQWLEKAYSERSPQLFNINVDPDYDGLRDDGRFTDLVSRLHLPQ